MAPMAILEEDGTTVPSAWDVARTPSGRTPSSQPIESSSLSKIAYRVRLCRGFFPIKSSTGLWNDTETTYHTNIQGKTILHYQPHAMRNQTPSKHTHTRDKPTQNPLLCQQDKSSCLPRLAARESLNCLHVSETPGRKVVNCGVRVV